MICFSNPSIRSAACEIWCRSCVVRGRNATKPANETSGWRKRIRGSKRKSTRLRKELETAQRATRRQAAPFSRGLPQSQPETPGRKSGAAHGRHHRRPIPDHVDEEVSVSAPAQCPACGGPLTVERVESQYQEEIVRRTWVRRFHAPVCRCAQCDRRVQGRHPLQFGLRRLQPL